MHIELQIREYSGGLKPFTQFLCKFPSQHKFMPVSAFVDTGSPTTNISLIEFDKVGLSVNSVIDREDFKKLSIGGAIHKAHPLHTAALFKFKSGQEVITLEPPEVYVLLPYSDDDRSAQQSANLPNIIGVDFLVHHDLGLYFNPSKDIAYLSDE